jgi:hypothetical protein
LSLYSRLFPKSTDPYTSNIHNGMIWGHLTASELIMLTFLSHHSQALIWGVTTLSRPNEFTSFHSKSQVSSPRSTQIQPMRSCIWLDGVVEHIKRNITIDTWRVAREARIIVSILCRLLVEKERSRSDFAITRYDLPKLVTPIVTLTSLQSGYGVINLVDRLL